MSPWPFFAIVIVAVVVVLVFLFTQGNKQDEHLVRTSSFKCGFLTLIPIAYTVI